jgi:hypothetical protein
MKFTTQKLMPILSAMASLAALATLPAWAGASDSNLVRVYAVPTSISCPKVLDYAVSLERQNLKMESNRSSLSAAEVLNPPENLFKYPRGTIGEYEPGPASLEVIKGEAWVVFGYANCDGSGKYSFKLDQLIRPLVTGYSAEVMGTAEAEVRGDGQKLVVICKANYAH